MLRPLLVVFSLVVFAMGVASAQQAPSASTIEMTLEAAPKVKLPKEKRVTRKEILRRPDLRRQAPSIEIQAINFGFDSADIPRRELGKVEEIATALKRILRRRPGEVFLIEGHTDAVGSREYNLALSERRAQALRSMLVREFGVPRYALEAIGYGEDYLLIPTQEKEWRNRRVTIRRITDFIR